MSNLTGDIPLSELAPDYTIEENRNLVRVATRVETTEKHTPEVSTCYFIKQNESHFIHSLCLWFMLIVTGIVTYFLQNFLISAVPLILVFICCIPYLSSALEVTDFSKKYWVSEEEAKVLLSKTIQDDPVLMQRIICFHNSKVQGGGDVEIESFRFEEPKLYADWFDTSPIQSIKLHKSTVCTNEVGEVTTSQRPTKLTNSIKRIYVKTNYTTADEETNTEFEQQKEQIIEDYKDMDENYHFNEEYYIDGVNSQLLINPGKAKKSCWYSYKLYVCCVCFGLSFPFRCLLEYFCVRSQVWISNKVLSSKTFTGNDLVRIRSGDIETASFIEEDQVETYITV